MLIKATLSNLDEFYDYGKYGRQHLEQSQGMFTEQGYISYHGILKQNIKGVKRAKRTSNIS